MLKHFYVFENFYIFLNYLNSSKYLIATLLLSDSLICSYSTLQQTIKSWELLRNWISVTVIKKKKLCCETLGTRPEKLLKTWVIIVNYSCIRYLMKDFTTLLKIWVGKKQKRHWYLDLLECTLSMQDMGGRWRVFYRGDYRATYFMVQ